jgi:hypothetical protein
VSALLPAAVRKRLGVARSLRPASLVIESLISNLKRQMRLDHHLAKTVAGLAQRVAQRLLALTLAMLLNILWGRPPRALDGPPTTDAEPTSTL